MSMHELAAAMRRGAALRPQCFDSYFMFDDRGDGLFPIESCALGAAYEGKTGRVDGNVMLDQIRQIFPEACGLSCRCPVCHDGTTVLPMVTHLNDHHRWTREHIADWLDAL